MTPTVDWKQSETELACPFVPRRGIKTKSYEDKGFTGSSRLDKTGSVIAGNYVTTEERRVEDNKQ